MTELLFKGTCLNYAVLWSVAQRILAEICEHFG